MNSYLYIISFIKKICYYLISKYLYVYFSTTKIMVIHVSNIIVAVLFFKSHKIYCDPFYML